MPDQPGWWCTENRRLSGRLGAPPSLLTTHRPRAKRRKRKTPGDKTGNTAKIGAFAVRWTTVLVICLSEEVQGCRYAVGVRGFEASRMGEAEAGSGKGFSILWKMLQNGSEKQNGGKQLVICGRIRSTKESAMQGQREIHALVVPSVDEKLFFAFFNPVAASACSRRCPLCLSAVSPSIALAPPVRPLFCKKGRPTDSARSSLGHVKGPYRAYDRTFFTGHWDGDGRLPKPGGLASKHLPQ